MVALLQPPVVALLPRGVVYTGIRAGTGACPYLRDEVNPTPVNGSKYVYNKMMEGESLKGGNHGSVLKNRISSLTISGCLLYLPF